MFVEQHCISLLSAFLKQAPELVATPAGLQAISLVNEYDLAQALGFGSIEQLRVHRQARSTAPANPAGQREWEDALMRGYGFSSGVEPAPASTPGDLDEFSIFARPLQAASAAESSTGR